MKLFGAKTIRFIVAGAINTLIGSGTMFFLYNVVNCSYWFSSASNYIVGSIVGFFLSKYFTFNKRTWSVNQVLKYVFTILCCYLFAYGLARPMASKMLHKFSVKKQDNIAMLFGMFVYTCLNYLGQSFFVFK